MTNEEKIKKMNRWDLAKFIYEVSSNAIQISVCSNECAKCAYSDDWCISEIGEWLLRGAEE